MVWGMSFIALHFISHNGITLWLVWATMHSMVILDLIQNPQNNAHILPIHTNPGPSFSPTRKSTGRQDGTGETRQHNRQNPLSLDGRGIKGEGEQIQNTTNPAIHHIHTTKSHKYQYLYKNTCQYTLDTTKKHIY